jgi:hypothetical protein
VWIWTKAGTIDPKKKKVKKCYVLMCWMFSLESWRLLLWLESPRGVPNKNIAFFIPKI